MAYTEPQKPRRAARKGAAPKVAAPTDKKDVVLAETPAEEPAPKVEETKKEDEQ